KAMAVARRTVRVPRGMARDAADIHEPVRPGGGQGAQGHRPDARTDLGRLRRARPSPMPDAHPARRLGRGPQRRPLDHRVIGHGRFRPVSSGHRQAGAQGLPVRPALRARAVHEGRGRTPAERGRRRRGRAPGGPRHRPRARHGPLQPGRGARLRGARMTALWEAVFGAEPRLKRWLGSARSELEVSRLQRPAWPIVAGTVARAAAGEGKAVLILVPGPDRFADELRLWLAGSPATHVFAEVAVSFLDRPPAFDEAVNRRLEALVALAAADSEPVVVVSSRRAITRQTISRRDLVAS